MFRVVKSVLVCSLVVAVLAPPMAVAGTMSFRSLLPSSG